MTRLVDTSPGEDFRPSPERDKPALQDGASQGASAPTGDPTHLIWPIFSSRWGSRSAIRRRSGEAAFSRRGQDYEVATHISLEDAARGQRKSP